jgi:hypothetical protein
MASLPGLFGTSLATIPRDVPYVTADPLLQERWRELFAGDARVRVGTAWAGSRTHARDRDRSLPFAMLAQVLARRDVRFVSLQKGPPAAEARSTLCDLAVDDCDLELTTFAETAALIAQLDLVVAVDTAVAHLAGAMGKPVWLLLPQHAEWRWLQGRLDSPWYPTMTLFRQPSDGDWSGAMEEVNRSLDRLLAGGPARSTAILSTVDDPFQERVERVDANEDGISSSETRAGLLQYRRHDHAGRSLAAFGEYRQDELDLVGSFVPQGAVVVTARSAYGADVLWLAAGVGDAGHVMCFEDRSPECAMLRQSAAVNRASNLTVLRRRLAARSTTGETAPVDTLDDLGLDRLDLVRIDESADAGAVIEGGQATLWRLRPLVLVASADGDGRPTAAGALKDCGYRVWSIDRPLWRAANYYRNPVDVLAGRRALALVALPEEVDPPLQLAGLDEF